MPHRTPLSPVPADVPEKLELLSRNRQAIIRPVFENPGEFVLLNVRDLAKRVDTAAATVVRIVRELGFESYREFQRYLHELAVKNSTILDTAQSSLAAGSTSKLLKSARKQIAANIDFVTDRVDLLQVQAIAQRLHDARRILLIGGDMAAMLVEYLEYRLLIAGFPVTAVTSPGRTNHLVRSLGEQDMAIGISFRRGLRMTIEEFSTHANVELTA
ncbi:MurR/RpiR family transcriptional regulator [Granulicella cerasi]|uniref:MurR/RpiR family transcriptional regulator n=1 Tax=Granulicella cerasi TaxID=741063 RepID=A0ABW1Z456_9BACT